MGYSIRLFKIENLVLRARSEVIGSAIDQICSRFQVSGVGCQEKQMPNTESAKHFEAHALGHII
jgi:hypothetical protein